MKTKLQRLKRSWQESSWSLATNMAYRGACVAYLLIRDKAKEELFCLSIKSRKS